MRTQEDSTPFNSDSEVGDDWEADSAFDNDPKALQHGGNNVPNPPVSSKDERNYGGSKDMLKDMTGNIFFGVGRLCSFQAVMIISILCLAIFASTESLCKIPVLSRYTPHCARELGLPRKPVANPDFVTLARLQSRLEQVMMSSASSSKIAVDMKDSEMALRDLGTMVKNSALSSKDILGQNLGAFVKDAKTTSANLQQFGSRVWGAVDRIVSLNEHTLIRLESISTGGGSSEGSGSWWGLGEGDMALQLSGPKEMENFWLQGIGLLDKTLRKLIHEAQDNVGSLQRLEERLNTVSDMVDEEKHEITKREQALKQQWFRELFRVNEGEWHSHSMSHALLEMVKKDRRNALEHVMQVLLKLKQMSNDLDDLREGAATPLVADSSKIPIEAHIKSMRDATERLMNGQTNMRQIEDDYRREKFSE